jgi:mono/diheme cytochrome c family protein
VILNLAAGVLVGACWLQAQQEPQKVASPQRALLNRYCVTCHNEKVKTAGLLLDRMDVEEPSTGAPVWEKVIRKLRTGSMPPAGLPRPDPATYDSFATYLETALDGAAQAAPNPGRPTIRRLNRAEYANSIRDLLAIDVDVQSLLPADDSGFGFDNIGDVLTVSPAFLERYMSAGRRVVRLAMGDPTIRPAADVYSVSRFLVQDTRMSDDLPFGSRGGFAVRHYFPLDGEYVVKIRLQRSGKDDIIGLGRPQDLDVRVDDERIRLFTVGRQGGDPSPYGELAKYEPDDGLEVRFQAKAGLHLVAAAFLKETLKSEGPLRRQRGAAQEGPGVGSVAIDGPYNPTGPGDTPSRRKIFLCHPAESREEADCAKRILSTLARRAYRRPVTDSDVEELMSLYQSGRALGFEAGIGRALQGLLVSTDFLFRAEKDQSGASAGKAYPVSDLALASRLSFFLWSSIPDDELLSLAEQGRLRDSGVLERQVRRMLADSRSKALVDNFAGQWLYLRNLRLASPDQNVFPTFDENLRNAFEQETKLFFASIVREDRSVLDLLNADYTFLNERLAQHYGIPNVRGSNFRRVMLGGHEERKGLLGQGSVLTVTSYATRTAPTLRGKWLLENILGAPPPPPPPDVPSLKETKEAKALTMRERLEQHRSNAVCASCHSRMDPLGFALENFDAIGGWRTTSGAANTPIDSSALLPDGTKFDGPTELRRILLERREEFVATLTEKLLTYALGRGIEYYDAPAIRKITREAAASNYTWLSLTIGIVSSTPFQMRRATEP